MQTISEGTVDNNDVEEKTELEVSQSSEAWSIYIYKQISSLSTFQELPNNKKYFFPKYMLFYVAWKTKIIHFHLSFDDLIPPLSDLCTYDAKTRLSATNFKNTLKEHGFFFAPPVVKV